MTEEEHDQAKLAALDALSAAISSMTCADSKIREFSASMFMLMDQPGSLKDWKFEGDHKVLIPDGSQAITETHRQVTYPSFEELRRVVHSRREAEQKHKDALAELSRLGHPLYNLPEAP